MSITFKLHKFNRSGVPIKTTRSLSISSSSGLENASDHMSTNRFEKVAFSVNSTRSNASVAFSNLSTLESVFKSLRQKRYVVFIVLVWTENENATTCLRFQ